MLVALAIIGLLISIVLVSIGNAGAKARDARRKADLDSIRKAILLYNHDKDDWIEMGSNCGRSGMGDGFFNLEYDTDFFGNPYGESISSCLIDAGYISTEIIDPSGDRNCTSTVGNCYMKFNSYSVAGVSEVYIYAKLETEPQNEDATNDTVCDACDTLYGMNYYLQVK